MNSIATLLLALLASSIRSDCLSSAQLATFNFTASSALVTYTASSPAAYCADYWTANGSCVKTDTWASQLAQNLSEPPRDDKFPRDQTASTSTASTTDADETACKAAILAVHSKYFCVLGSGVASASFTFDSSNVLSALAVDDADATSIYNACAVSFNKRCVADAAANTSSTTTASSSTTASTNSASNTTAANQDVKDDRAAQCTNIAACIAASSGANCLADIKANVLRFFKDISQRSSGRPNGGPNGDKNGPPNGPPNGGKGPGGNGKGPNGGNGQQGGNKPLLGRNK